MITKNQASQLRIGQTIYQLDRTNYDGTAVRWRINGTIKTWKHSPHRFQVPLKHGLYDYAYLTEVNAHLLTITEPEPLMPKTAGRRGNR